MITFTSFRRADHDFYPTPPEAVRALLSVEQFDGTIWEPACGNGAISRELESHGHRVVSTDLIDRSYGQSGCDFLSAITPTRVRLEHPDMRHIVTNPPYSYRRGIADKFVGQALRVTRETGGKVAMLLKPCPVMRPAYPIRFNADKTALLLMCLSLLAGLKNTRSCLYPDSAITRKRT